MENMISPNKTLQLTWEEFLVKFKRNFYSAQSILELGKKLLTLKKGSMSIDVYTNAFTDKMEFPLCIVLDVLANINMYTKGSTLCQYIRDLLLRYPYECAKFVDKMITGRTTNKAKVGETRKYDASSRNNNN